MKCYVCGCKEYKVRDGKCRDSDTLKIYECAECGLVYLSSFDHIGEKFYEENGQVESNKKSNIFNTASFTDTQRRFDQFALKLANKHILDFGCGAGSFLKKLKQENITDTLYSLEINRKYHATLNQYLKHFTSINEIEDSSLDYITMFHVLEHLADPLQILNELYKKLKVGGKIIIEVPSAEDVLLKTYKSDAFSNFTYWSCHLYLFNLNTLDKLIKKTPFKIDYIKQYQRYSLANHLHWLSRNKPAGHLEFSFLEDDMLNGLYAKKLAELGQCDTIMAEIIKK